MRCRHTVPLLVDAPGRLTWPSDVSLLLQVSSLLLAARPSRAARRRGGSPEAAMVVRPSCPA